MLMQQDSPLICVMGLGYIGLPTAAVFARAGFAVTGVDIDPKIVASINAGQAHFVEIDLDGLIQSVVSNGTLKAQPAPIEAAIYIVAVPTPLTNKNAPDLTFVEAALDQISPLLPDGALIILESTVPPGTTQKMCERLEQNRPDLRRKGGVGAAYHMAHCPERVLPGRILTEIIENDRIIGGITPDCAEKARDFYQAVVRGDCKLTDAKTAEFTKLAENAYRDINIAYANELSLVCEDLDVNVWDLIDFANRHPRVNILKPGPGVGGHCIAVDPLFIAASAPRLTPLIQTARSVNDSKPGHVLATIEKALLGIHTPSIACLGLSFKADVDDLRSSPALKIAEKLADKYGDAVYIVEPHIDALPDSLAATGARLTSLEDALTRADMVVLLVDHTVFKRVTKDALKDKIIIDTRGVWR